MALKIMVFVAELIMSIRLVNSVETEKHLLCYLMGSY